VQRTEKSGFSLDTDRIAALQRDSEKVSALLANIFTENEASSGPTHNMPSGRADQVEEAASVASLIGLDHIHSGFARALMRRQSWTREELADVAHDMEIMLDGALERVNEAAYDAFDIPFTEGADPIEVNPEILEKIA
jgi:hypothetical protein